MKQTRSSSLVPRFVPIAFVVSGEKVIGGNETTDCLVKGKIKETVLLAQCGTPKVRELHVGLLRWYILKQVGLTHGTRKKTTIMQYSILHMSLLHQTQAKIWAEAGREVSLLHRTRAKIWAEAGREVSLLHRT